MYQKFQQKKNVDLMLKEKLKNICSCFKKRKKKICSWRLEEPNFCAVFFAFKYTSQIQKVKF